MNRNVESHFSELPQIDIQRSMFDRSCSHKTSFNVGQLIPFYIDEVLPGDTFNVTTSSVVRLQTPLTPIMDNMYLDTYYFFVPNRLSWIHWKEFMGENTSSPWLSPTFYTIPKMLSPTGGWNVGTIADYLGVPTGVDTASFVTAGDDSSIPSALPFRAYALICNEWFRDQNLEYPLTINTGDTSTSGSNGSLYVTDTAKGGSPFPVAKYHDYFTSCLPSPQKGPNVGLWSNNIGDTTFHKKIPVYSTNVNHLAYMSSGDPLAGIKFAKLSDLTATSILGQNDGVNYPLDAKFFKHSDTFQEMVPYNLWADAGPLDLSINELRLAFQLQKFYEKNARAGTRYREVLKEHFGVTSSDARMQIPEYLGGHRFPLSIHQVANQSQGATDFLGDLGAMSNTSDVHSDFIKSFEEHGFVIGVCCVRYDHSYPQGLERFWSRNNNTDYYYPVFANIGEQPVYKREIYWSTSNTKDEVFGYNEAWADYRYKPNRVSGEMRPGIANSLASWHLSDYYTTKPSLSDTWIMEDGNLVDRVLSVAHSVSNQVFCDFYVQNICTRAMPMYSVPGLIDHH